MNYTVELLEKIQDLASKLTPITEIGALLELNEVELRDDIQTKGHPARKAFYMGYARTALGVRKRNLELAEAGSPSAEDAVSSYIRKIMNEL